MSDGIYLQPNKTMDIPLTVTVLLAIYDGKFNKQNKRICQAKYQGKTKRLRRRCGSD
jgi:hypothetical protein